MAASDPRTTRVACPDAYWSHDASALLAALATSPGGLSSIEAAGRLGREGPNVIAEQREVAAIRMLLHQFASPLVLILVFGAGVSIFVRDWVDAAIILAIVLGSAVLGFTQEYRASLAIAELRQRLALTARVLRDGAVQTIVASQIVPGDVIELSAGNLVPADGVILDARDFLVTEASLTGESMPVEKQPGTVQPGAPASARANCAFMGTSVRSGTATVLVVKTGRATVFGAAAAGLGTRPAEPEFARGVRQFGYLLLRIMIVMVLFVLAVNQLLGRPAIESLLFAVALAVGISPELLPAIVSVTLAHGARAMARRGVIVRHPEALESLGSMDVLCTDKTGTLTAGVMALDAAVDVDGSASAGVLRLAHLNAALETGIENPLDAALVTAGENAGLSAAGCTKIDEIPYDFVRKRMTVVVAAEDDARCHQIIMKGAFANVLGTCTTVSRGGAEVPLDDGLRERFESYYRDKGTEGFRVIALATRRVPAQEQYAPDDEAGMSLAGFLLFFDPPKAQAAQTVRDLAARGVQVKVITGDNRHVAAHVAGAIGLDPKAMLTGEAIAGLRDEALWHLAERTDLFVEVDPQQKERIVRALQRTGHSVGYLGDGINDAPALHAADVGISVDQAVDVARESADVVLLRPDLDVLRRGVDDGRRTFANTLKYIYITTSANFGNMMSMALATPLLPFLPLAAKQILLNNFLSDLPAIAIATDSVDAERVARAQRWDVVEVKRFMVVFGLVSTVFDLLTFFVLLRVFDATESVFQTGWFLVSLLTELAVVLVLRTHGPALRSMPAPLLLWTSIAVAVLAVAVPFMEPFARVFGFVALPWPLLGAMIAIVVGYVLATEFAKRRFYRDREPR
ncbi:MAG: magnesium-translocating P-type ATPase [Betaproteobacteria bacterium]|nr:magnesium-translocating P-type ATPase [Betaproteobacteria bacterium]